MVKGWMLLLVVCGLGSEELDVDVDLHVPEQVGKNGLVPLEGRG